MEIECYFYAGELWHWQLYWAASLARMLIAYADRNTVAALHYGINRELMVHGAKPCMDQD